MDIVGFEGTLKGSGAAKTVIFVKGPIDQNSQLALNLLPCWLRIIGGNVVLSDLTIKTGNGSLVAETDPFYAGTLISLIVVNNYFDDYGKDDPQPMDFTVKNVNILCGKTDPANTYLGFGYNVLMPFWVGFPYWYSPPEGYVLTKGNYNVINCNFESAFQGPEVFGLGEEGICNIDHIKTNDDLIGIFCTANYNSRINITNCTFLKSKFFDVMIDDAEWGYLGKDYAFKRTRYQVTGNTFITSQGITSLAFQDTEHLMFPDLSYQPTLAIIKNNWFCLKEGATGINLFNMIDGQVKNNIFTGSGNTGIYVDGMAWSYFVYPPEMYTGSVSKNALILGNSFFGLSSVYDIVLGESSMDCTVVGNGKESVLDNGTNNKITGMKKHAGGHFGPAIRDNFRMWHNIRHR
jgi:hypothetical protein